MNPGIGESRTLLFLGPDQGVDHAVPPVNLGGNLHLVEPLEDPLVRPMPQLPMFYTLTILTFTIIMAIFAIVILIFVCCELWDGTKPEIRQAGLTNGTSIG